jgi:cyanate permease
MFGVPAPALMSQMAADARHRAKALGLWSAYMPTGGTIALLAAPLLIALASWRALWLALALASVLAAVALGRAVPSTARSQVSSLRLVSESLAQPGNIMMALLFACYVAQWTSVMVWLPTLLSEHGASTATAAIATALMVLANVPGNLTGGWLLARGVPRGWLVIAGSGVAAFCEIGMLSSAVPGSLRFALVLVFSFSSGVIPSSIFAGLPVHARSPQHIATGNGMVLQFSNIGQFFGPLIAAWMASGFGAWEASLPALLAFALGGAACGAVLGRIENKMKR